MALGSAEACVRLRLPCGHDALHPLIGEKALQKLVKETRPPSRRSGTGYAQCVAWVEPLSADADGHAGLSLQQHRLPTHMQALGLLQRYRDTDGKVRSTPKASVPVEGIAPKAWHDIVIRGRPHRAHPVRAVRAREALLRREVYMAGANRWRHPRTIFRLIENTRDAPECRVNDVL